MDFTFCLPGVFKGLIPFIGTELRQTCVGTGFVTF